MNPAIRDQLIPVPADRCAKNCTYLTSCHKFRGFTQPHVCVPFGGTDATVYFFLLAMAALLLALILGVFLYCVGTFVANKWKKNKSGSVNLVELRTFQAMSDLTAI